ALKETGHKHITYMGTAGAFPDKGYKVGDLVIPSHYLDEKGKMVARGTAMEIDGAKVGGVVEHVASPFDETFQWLATSSQRSDLVEIETNYLGRIFTGNDAHVRSYLLVSDVLGSEGETLANASSSKRRNSLNKLLGSLFDRDKASAPKPLENLGLTGNAQKHWNLRATIDQALPKNGTAFKYHIYSTFQGSHSPDAVVSYSSSIPTFTDDFHIKKLTEGSESLTAVINRIRKDSPLPNLAVPMSYLDGKWNPKTDELRVLLLASNTQVANQYQQVLDNAEDILGSVSRWLKLEVVKGSPP